MDILFNAIESAGNTSAQIAPAMVIDMALVQAIISANSNSGSYSGQLGITMR